jgi:transcriptional regulator with XRE-family HTH domain/quercetin dioxygenase-like cupin family protein
MTPVTRGADGSDGSLPGTRVWSPGRAASEDPARKQRVNTTVVPPIGERIREERARLGVTVRGLARDIGVSASLISQIETGRSQPSVSTLYAIVTALGVSIEDLFAPGPTGDEDLPPIDTDGHVTTGDAVTVDQAVPRASGWDGGEGTGRDGGEDIGRDGGEDVGRDAGTGMAAPRPGLAQAVQRDRDRRVGPVVHPDDRETLTLESGVIWELLGQVPGLHVDFLLVTYQPGGSSSTSGTLMRHSGIEYGYIMAGELILTLGFDEHQLHAGDAISFDSTTPHGYRNEGSEPAVGVWFVTEPTR